ncbi:MAG: glycoside hydrolase family 3 protein, partial [Rhodobacteraceae bacterium]|nr:glycoside hydrolase family 3 protein [Paracoccaceae bacterium]
DLVEPGTHRVLLNRLYGSDVLVVTEAAKTAAEALLDGGVLPVMKHMPGHGRAAVDSHLDLPRVSASAEALAARDFAPFYGLRHLKMAMSAHVVYEAIDPDSPATVSPAMLRVIRAQIGFDGLIMTDDISMQALSGSVDERCAGALAAGCDVILHSNGIMSDMIAAMSAVGEMSTAAQRRGQAALDQRRSPSIIDAEALRAELAELLRPVE